MKCLVTGGAGHIGSNLVRELLRLKHKAFVLDDLSSGNLGNLAGCQGVNLIYGSVTSQYDVEKAVKERPDVVFHLAASVGCLRSVDNPRKDAEVNVLGTVNLLDTCRRFNVARVVYSSSAAIYGKTVTLPIDEGHPCEPETHYGASKLGGEKECLAYAKIFGMSICCLRYFNVYGLGQTYNAYGNVIPIFARQVLDDQRLTIYGDGNQTRDYVHVDDVVQANLLASQSGKVEVYNVGTGVGTSINDLANLVENYKSNESSYRSYLPKRQGDVEHSVACIGKIREELGYSPKVNLKDGLDNYIKELKDRV